MPILVRGDARSLPLPDESVDLVVTSPPYFGLRDYGYDGQIGSEPTPGEFLDALLACTSETMRVLKPSGSIFVNLGDKYGPNKSLLWLPERYRIRCTDEFGLIGRAVVIWAKPNGLPESVTDRVRRSHEDWVHLTKSPRYYSAVDEIREPHKYPLDERWRRQVGGDYDKGASGHINSGLNPLGKLPGSVWEIATQPLNVPAELGVDHFAAFPMEWPRRIIQGWSPREVCTACGEGRRPVTDVKREVDRYHARQNLGKTFDPGRVSHHSGDAPGAVSTLHMTAARTITGYACACTPRVGREIREYDYETDSWVTRTATQADVAGWTPPPSTPGVVLDPFSGTGTTALIAAMLGRTGIGVELSADYIRLAQWRASDPKERARAAGLDPDQVSAIKKQLPGQVDMFELLAGEAS